MRDTFLTVSEIAEMLGRSPENVRNQIDRGEIPAVRLGRRVRIRRADLDRLIAAPKTTAPEPEHEPTPEVESPEPTAEHWARLDAALGDSRAALTNEDQTQLVAALRALASAADRLADTLAPSGRP